MNIATSGWPEPLPTPPTKCLLKNTIDIETTQYVSTTLIIFAAFNTLSVSAMFVVYKILDHEQSSTKKHMLSSTIIYSQVQELIIM